MSEGMDLVTHDLAVTHNLPFWILFSIITLKWALFGEYSMAMSIKKWFEKLRGGRPAPVIPTPYGEPVTESARAQCALNMREDPAVKARVEAVLIQQYGHEQGLRLARQRYPEAYD